MLLLRLYWFWLKQSNFCDWRHTLYVICKSQNPSFSFAIKAKVSNAQFFVFCQVQPFNVLACRLVSIRAFTYIKNGNLHHFLKTLAGKEKVFKNSVVCPTIQHVQSRRSRLVFEILFFYDVDGLPQIDEDCGRTKHTSNDNRTQTSCFVIVDVG